ncbi:MAG: hypothetical protein KGQ28_10340, partial [Hyphomicrobiales bacterium]|nr:hypothetical protein [Hyphomicrobiales bacterium]
VPAQVEPPAAQGAATAPSPPSASAPAAAPAPAMDPATADKFIARASDMIAQGDIAGARLMLGPAAEGGSAKAMFALAQTYDPATLAQWKVIGLQGDKAKAIAWYDRALKAGDSAAAGALAKLR